MTMYLEKRGPDVTRDQLKDVCTALGYNAADVRSIHAEGNGPVVVEAFLRAPDPSSERGVRVSSGGPGAPYAFVRVTHHIAPSARIEDDDRQSSMTDERLAMIEATARRGTELTPLEVFELTAEIRRLKEDR